MTYHYYKDSKGEWRWRLKAANSRILAGSGTAPLFVCLNHRKPTDHPFPVRLPVGKIHYIEAE